MPYALTIVGRRGCFWRNGTPHPLWWNEWTSISQPALIGYWHMSHAFQLPYHNNRLFGSFEIVEFDERFAMDDGLLLHMDVVKWVEFNPFLLEKEVRWSLAITPYWRTEDKCRASTHRGRQRLELLADAPKKEISRLVTSGYLFCVLTWPQLRSLLPRMFPIAKIKAATNPACPVQEARSIIRSLRPKHRALLFARSDRKLGYSDEQISNMLLKYADPDIAKSAWYNTTLPIKLRKSLLRRMSVPSKSDVLFGANELTPAEIREEVMESNSESIKLHYAMFYMTNLKQRLELIKDMSCSSKVQFALKAARVPEYLRCDLVLANGDHSQVVELLQTKRWSLSRRSIVRLSSHLKTASAISVQLDICRDLGWNDHDLKRLERVSEGVR